MAGQAAGDASRVFPSRTGVLTTKADFLGSGRLAQSLPEERPDLILLDLDLPDLPGREVSQSSRADPVTRNIPGVVIRANARPRMIEQTLAVGAKADMTKPINVRDCLNDLDEQLVAVTG